MMPRAVALLTPAELVVFRRRLNTPAKVQHFLDAIPYNIEADGDTFRSPRRVLRDRTANCIEGAVLAAAALRVQGNPQGGGRQHGPRSEEHTSELQSPYDLVCRRLREKKKSNRR